MPHAVILSHREVADDIGLIGRWLDESDWTFERIWREDSPDWPDADLFIALGSLASVATGHCTPSTEREIARIREWVDQDRPYLGVCFGAQALAVALGGTVERMPTFFRGVTDAQWAGGTRRGPWVAWHEDAIRSVGSGDVLGQADHAILGLRHGRAWGVQPHVELDADGVQRLGKVVGAPTEVWEPIAAHARECADALRAATFALMDDITRT